MLKETLLVLIAAIAGGVATLVVRRWLERRTSQSLRNRLLDDLDDMRIIATETLQDRNWHRREAKVQAERILTHYDAGDAIEAVGQPFVKKELLEYLRFLGIFVEWFDVGGPFKQGELSLEDVQDGSIDIEDIVAKSPAERFQFVQASFRVTIETIAPEDPFARRRMERAAHLLVKEARSFLGGGVGTREVFNEIHSKLQTGLESQSRQFYERLQVHTAGLIDLLADQ